MSPSCFFSLLTIPFFFFSPSFLFPFFSPLLSPYIFFFPGGQIYTGFTLVDCSFKSPSVRNSPRLYVVQVVATPHSADWLFGWVDQNVVTGIPSEPCWKFCSDIFTNLGSRIHRRKRNTTHKQWMELDTKLPLHYLEVTKFAREYVKSVLTWRTEEYNSNNSRSSYSCLFSFPHKLCWPIAWLYCSW